ncbi:PQQ-dependent sugar dehydrogenase [Methanotrichaceae archaeon M04Ac]|uniref:PQQ-dependent sugar dehydrogenase n=1 Tax=Candidatus Methanocrinis alkalitolerans TaxID=3033395 RepID=A0ABT5XGZ5_9EURY|nr:PQQ-dependent sugar dehydrogenase [Candidatus Methanocrinis alkalitolerans]MDF0593901.1 PQQ-dependent sugar dehydrogenase [Candidatus Methanocrinis alkalitolerans]
MKKGWVYLFALLFVVSWISPTQCEDQLDATVEIRSFSFQPESITVPAGTTVTWINRDPFAHTVTADDGSFDSGSIRGNGGEFHLALSEPGTFPYHCTPHPSMRGEIIVAPAEMPDLETGEGPRVGVELVAEGFTAPMGFITSRDGTGRIFLIDQVGLVKIVYPNGTVLEEPFLDLTDRMVELRPGFDERGLLGLAFHPEFSENGRVFVFYTGPLRPQAPDGWDSTNRLSEFSISTDDPNRVDMGSERVLLRIDKPQFNHNGGTIDFGPDGYLYVPIGDGGGANDVGLGHPPDGNGQNTTTLLGKILRIDVDETGDDAAYGIPADNPFVDDEDIPSEIYALGFRNPWRIAFDTGGDGALLVSDAGQDLWEEVNLVVKGGNYGWNIREGTHCFDPADPRNPPQVCPEVDARGEMLIDPVIEYGHDLGTAVVGGYIYRGQALSDMVGRYIFADWSNSFSTGNGTLLVATPSEEGLWVWEEVYIADSPTGRLDLFIRSLGIDDDGELYILASDRLGPVDSTGAIFKIAPPPEGQNETDEG